MLACLYFLRYPNKYLLLFIPKNNVDDSGLLTNTLTNTLNLILVDVSATAAVAVLCANEAMGHITANRRHWEIITLRFNESRLAVYLLLVCPGVCPSLPCF